MGINSNFKGNKNIADHVTAEEKIPPWQPNQFYEDMQKRNTACVTCLGDNKACESYTKEELGQQNEPPGNLETCMWKNSYLKEEKNQAECKFNSQEAFHPISETECIPKKAGESARSLAVPHISNCPHSDECNIMKNYSNAIKTQEMSHSNKSS